MKKILLLNFCMLILFNFAHPVTPQMMIEKDIPDYLFGVFFFMMSAGMFVFSPIWGQKIDVHGTKKIMVIAPLIYSIGQLLFFYFSSPILMCIGRLLSGIFSSAWIVGTTSYINVLSTPETKVKNFGYQLVATNLGGMIGQLASGYIGLSNYANSFVVQIIFLIILGLICWFSLENLHPQVKSKQKSNFLASVKSVYHNGFSLLIIAMICLATISNIVKGLPSYFASDVVGFTTSQVGMLNSYTAFLGLLSNLVIIRFIEKNFSFSKSYTLQIIATLIGSVILTYSVFIPSSTITFYLPFICGITVVGIGSSMYLPFTQKRIINSQKFNEGEILGALNSFNAIGMLLSSASMSFIYPIKPQLPFLGLFVFSIFAIISHLFGSKNETAT